MSRLSITFLKHNLSPQMGLGRPRVEFHSPAHGLSAAMWILCNQHCGAFRTEASDIDGKYSPYANCAAPSRTAARADQERHL